MGVGLWAAAVLRAAAAVVAVPAGRSLGASV